MKNQIFRQILLGDEKFKLRTKLKATQEHLLYEDFSILTTGSYDFELKVRV